MYQLIVKGEQGKYVLGDSSVVDLPAETLEEAKEQAKEVLYGFPSKWGVSLQHNGRIRFYLDGYDDVYNKYEAGPFLSEHQRVYSATLVKVEEVVDLEPLRNEISEAKARLTKEVELKQKRAQLEKLKAELGET